MAPFFKAHCVRCHGPKRQKGQGEGDLRLDTINIHGEPISAADVPRWKAISDRLSLGEMPPKEEPRPPRAEVDKVIAWIAAKVETATATKTNSAEGSARASDGRVVLRRMNRAEYANTIRDLFNVRFYFDDGPMDLLPPDGTSDGFDKIGSALMLDPSLMSRYLMVARRVADAAVISGPRPFETRRKRFEYKKTLDDIALKYLCREPGVACRTNDLALMNGVARTWVNLRLDPERETTIPVDGEYAFRIRMSADLGTRREPLKVALEYPEETAIATWTLTEKDAVPRVFELRVPVTTARKGLEGPRIHVLNGTDFSKITGPLDATARAKLPKVVLDWIEIEGPLIDQWPPRSYREIFFEGPRATKDAAKDLAYARRIFQRLMRRAYRRPVSEVDVREAVSRVERELQAGETFDEAVRVGLEFVLCAPSFLFLMEPNLGPARPLDDFELATRLSYFLWSTMPDEELLRLAEQRRLRSPGVLDEQVRRMLRDPRSSALVVGFGAQWLQAAKFAGIPPSRLIYQHWDDELEAAVKHEPLAFFEEILRGDLSVLNFLDSDFAMLNDRLARHYGIPGVEGAEFRRVRLPPGSHRGGLVTQAGILTIGSDGTRTLPVRRAAWILQTLFNRPPPPPPPNVREVEPNIQGKRLTVRERLLQHQNLPACASCHRGIDPYGLGLESYDAVGAWRTRQNGEDFWPDGERPPDIDASGTLPDGRTFRTAEEFRALLRADQDRFLRALAEKMLTYALGRNLEAVDAGSVVSLVTALGRGQNRMSALIAAIVSSQPFQTK